MRATGLRGGKPADPSVQSPSLRRSPCSSIRKGVPLYGWKNRGEAPRRWLLSEPRLVSFRPRPGAAHAHEGPQPQAALRATGPTLGISCPVNRVPGVVSGEREALRATQKTASFPVEHTSRQLSRPRKAECPVKTGAPGAGAGGRQGFAPGEPAPSSGTHAHRRVLPGDSGLSRAWAVKSLALVQTAPPCPLAANLDLATSTL